MTTRNSHLVVVGSGIAGLFASLLAAEAGLRVTLVTKGVLAASNTHFAQGGICAVLGADESAPGDSVAAHVADTLAAGAGQCDPEAVRVLCAEAGADILALERFGVVFDKDPDTGRRSLGLEGAHSAARILHAGGDATGAAIADGLIRSVRCAEQLGTIRILENTFVQDLVLSHGRVTGVELLHGGGRERLGADAVLLASGGAGQLFEHTTNPSVATADGLAAAWRAGAVVADLEFFQFHPTALAVGENFLISEAVRGAGAVLRDGAGNAFMTGYHLDGDLAPRDVVSRSMAAHLARTGPGASSLPGGTLFLDATGVEAAHGAGYLARRFPTIDAKTRELGFDWTRQWLPVAPAAHYWMGGVATHLDAQTSLPGLYAAGEVACTGVHGANRLASNSLLEGLVFGRRAVQSFVADTQAGGDGAHAPVPAPAVTQAATLDLAGTGHQSTTEPLNRESLRRLMGEYAGVVRDRTGLQKAAGQLAAWRSQSALPGDPWIAGERPAEDPATLQAGAELENLRLVAELLVHAALARTESVGAHYRSDYPPATASTTEPTTATAAVPGGRRTAAWVASLPGEFTHIPTSLPVLESETV
ncbi:L-aspartate oxidase [Arthrobacter sp. ERGS1:01]|uniref:L-aspartate oxidase n=1 Tax=Arthrobacter sp. ERGS1:01 TaxID=1704044 RepID=UPI0009EB3AFD|nr:L-aspartate oxidase [Arthrobacter sp. ERGS1:01]